MGRHQQGHEQSGRSRLQSGMNTSTTHPLPIMTMLKLRHLDKDGERPTDAGSHMGAYQGGGARKQLHDGDACRGRRHKRRADELHASSSVE